ncbi:MAG: polyprenol monophosphomannose synthase [Candidatus Bathyarchaeota archaeon]|nr:polyprenol monophosphomannose synthase [Candidatus Bathyarchaeota archaeon]
MSIQVPSSTSLLNKELIGNMSFEVKSSKSIEGNLDMNSEVGVILPTYCEAQNIEKLIDEIENLDLNTSILVIDDSSPDGTSDIVRKCQRKHDNILLFERPKKFGLGTAITDGFRIFLSVRNPPKYIITMDADYSHNPKEIPKLIAPVKKGFDLVVGSRYCQGGSARDWSIIRLAVSKVANLLTKLRINAKISDYTSGMRCYSTKLVRGIINDLHSRTYEIQIETIRQANLGKFRIREIPITFVNRKKGRSKLTINEIKDFFSYIFSINRKY